MCAAKKQRSSNRSTSRSKRVREYEDDNRPSGILAGCAMALFVARFFVPTEASEAGETLWLTQCWLALAVLWMIDALRRGGLRVRLDRFDFAVGVLVAGHIVSAIAVLLTEGQKRAALNMLWEWAGLGISWGLMRRVLQTSEDRQRFLWGFASVATVLAGLGLYQHFVWYPEQLEWYQTRRTELGQLETIPSEPLTQLEIQKRKQRIRELQTEFFNAGISLNGANRIRWEDRLNSSTEPFGKFGLANTFAGLLGVAFLPMLAVFLNGIRKRNGWKTLAGPAIATILIGYCLILTKSRTAWVGVFSGLVIWGWFTRERNLARLKIITWGVAGVAMLGAAIAFAILSGGLDKETISESPKSLKYRLQYWTGTVAMLSERPVLGTGPGNFRQHYLNHKAAESSEEIRDPHNLILDVWANGGILALAGLLLLIGFGMQRMLKEAGNATETIETASLDQRNSNSSPSYAGLPSAVWSLGALSGMLLVILKGSLLDQGMDEQILTLMIGVAITFLCTFRGFQTTKISTACLMGTWCLLLVHLLGAGGMEMPAIIQIILVLPILVPCPARGEIATDPKVKQSVKSQRTTKTVLPLPTPTEKFTGMIGLTLTATLSGLCLITSTIPVQMRQWYLAAGNYEWGVTRKISVAAGFFGKAAEKDSLSPEPLSRLAGVAYQKWRRGGHKDSDYHYAIKRQQDAIQRDPNNFSGYVVLGEWRAERFSLTEDRAEAHVAVESFQQALARYPNHSHIVAKLAVLLNQMKNPPINAMKTAQKAIELDDINRKEGHRDRVFEGKLRKILEEISVSPAR